GVDAARARSEGARAAYAGVVLEALREVEDAFVRCEMLSWRMKELEVRLREARSAEELADDRYSKGLETILIVLETERRRRLAENELVSTKGQLFGGRIDLFLALGGDWGVGDEDVLAADAVAIDPEGVAVAADENSYADFDNKTEGFTDR
ncbi:MAG: TolC family protein, partial [Planctomycetes bacterium]|nr:TolC family protein [Planctomycetota bacterium]